MDNNTSNVNSIDYDKYGCDCCKARTFSSRGGRCSIATCIECRASRIKLADGVKESNSEISDSSIYPDGGGEYWSPRGVGYDLSGFVRSKEAGERIVSMIEKIIKKKPESWLDYRENEPNWIQVKIQKDDGFDLNKLIKLCREDGIITEERLKESLISHNS